MRRDPRNDWQLFGNYYLAITIHFAILYRTWIEKKPLKPSQAEGDLYSTSKPGWEHQEKMPLYGSKCVSNFTMNTRKESSPGIQRWSWCCLWFSVENGRSTHSFFSSFPPRRMLSFSTIVIFSNKVLNSTTVHTGCTVQITLLPLLITQPLILG